MDTIAKRLAWARARAGYPTPTEAARTRGWTISTYLGHENGDRNPSRATAKKYARAFKVRWEWLLENEGPATGGRVLQVPVQGFVGAAAEIRPFDGDSRPTEEEVELPPGAGADTAVVIVRGDSMYPRYFDGEHLFYKPEQMAPTELVGKECVVGLKDGRVLVKILRKGSKRTLFNLESWNAPMIEDQQVEWAAPVRWRG